MSEIDTCEKTKPLSTLKFRLVALVSLVSMSLVGFASAAIDFANITALINEVILIIPGLLNLVVGIAPIIITIAVISFIVMFIDRILSMMKMR
jgi:uncharacterized membrane protein